MQVSLGGLKWEVFVFALSREEGHSEPEGKVFSGGSFEESSEGLNKSSTSVFPNQGWINVLL